MNETQNKYTRTGNVLKTKENERDKAWKQMSMKTHNDEGKRTPKTPFTMDDKNSTLSDWASEWEEKHGNAQMTVKLIRCRFFSQHFACSKWNNNPLLENANY